MLDYRINTFLTVCETMNYTKAANILCITQPAVSNQIKQLQAEYDVSLFIYKEKKLSLTDYGEMLKNYALTMRHDNEMLKRTISEKAGSRKEFSFGGTMTAGPYVAANYLSKFLKSNPDTNIRMTVASTKTLLKKIDNGEIDFALIEGHFSHSEYTSQVYSSESFCAVVSADYKFKKNKIYSIDDLLGERLLLREKGSGSREILEYALKNKNLKTDDFTFQTEVNNIEVLKLLAEDSCGVTFLYERAVQKEISEGKLKKVSVPGFSINHDFSFVCRKNSMYKDIYTKFFNIL